MICAVLLAYDNYQLVGCCYCHCSTMSKEDDDVGRGGAEMMAVVTVVVLMS